ncbi:VPLPA-CTERM sorting domain-containing protein [Sneathiella glossodoripedis]|uniref:VPLPA-CTERM sorting domain-containing protein n=1 Tax=Sneathiella glossodoripedis TaxID=418853 RepID=UPI0004719E47|nr:VPLPA-CTERM sorting domain-containing protein [Sneathiella glossodoripedis]
MRVYFLKLLGVISLLLWASHAGANTYDFTSGNGIKLGNSYRFAKGGITVDATPHSTLAIPSFPDIHQDGNGLGITSHRWDDGEVDGYGADETIKLTFSTSVMLESILFGDVGFNDHFRYRVEGGSWVTRDISGSGNNGYFDFALPGILGTVLEIGAEYWNDDFMVRGVKVSAVPLPPAVLLFGAALAGLGWFRRRKMGQA